MRCTKPTGAGGHAHTQGAVVGANSVVGEGVRVGRGTVLRFGVALSHCNVGAGCVLHHGVAAGADGFGFDVDPATGRVLKKPQELRVLIGDEVEIGANSCVDRGSWRDTVVGDQCKLDNMVQVGHNALLGTGCLLCGHVALGGSSELGDYVVMGGKSAVKDHVKVRAPEVAPAAFRELYEGVLVFAPPHCPLRTRSLTALASTA